ncbi:MAG: hypothetical protein AABZ35_04090, partial [Gemmatimonadota bacterium]
MATIVWPFVPLAVMEVLPVTEIAPLSVTLPEVAVTVRAPPMVEVPKSIVLASTSVTAVAETIETAPEKSLAELSKVMFPTPAVRVVVPAIVRASLSVMSCPAVVIEKLPLLPVVIPVMAPRPALPRLIALA